MKNIFRSIFVYVIISHILLFTSWQCFELPPDPVMPSWTTQLSIPLVDTVFYLNDALQDNPDIMIQGPNYVYHPAQFKFDSLSVGDQLVLHPDPSLTIEQRIGTFNTNIVQPINAFVNAETILGTVPPTPTVIPPFNWEDTLFLRTIKEFEYAHFASGDVSLELRNGLPIPITFSDGLGIINSGSEDYVAYFPAITIQPYSTWSPPSASLANKTVRKGIKIFLKMNSDGSSGNTVLVNPDSGLSVSLRIANGVADEIRGQTFERLEYSTAYSPYLFDDSTYFNEITLKKGAFRLQVENTLEIGVTAHIEMKEFVNASTNESFELDIPLDANANLTYDYDLTEWKIRAVNGLSKTATCSLRVASTSLGSPTPVTVHANDLIRLTLLSTDTPYVIKKVTGVSKPIWLDVNDTVDLDIGNLSSNFSADSVVLDSITMQMNLFSAIGHPVDLHLQVKGLNSSGATIATMALQPGGGSSDPNAFRIQPNQHSALSFTNLSRFVSDFLTHRGERILIHGTALVNPYDVYASLQTGTVEDTTNVYTSLDVNALISIGIFNGVFADTVDIGGDGEDKIDKDVLNRIKQASVFFKIENALPMGVELTTSFQNVSNTPILTLPKVSDPAIAINEGTPANPSRTLAPIRIGIQPSDADKFNDAERIIVQLKVNSGNQITPFTTSDYIRVRAYANIVVEIKEK